MLLRGRDGRAWLEGLCTCHSVWECPDCAARKTTARRAEVHADVCAWAEVGAVYLLTLTVRHDRGDRLSDLRRSLATAWAEIGSGRSGQAFRARWGVRGFDRRAELTHGVNGWHPHYHVLLYLDAPLTRPELRALRREVWDRWSGALGRLSRGCNARRGVDVRPADNAGRYLAKMGLASEVTGEPYKSAKNGNRNPWELLEDFAAGDEESGRLWSDYCMAMRGARQLERSRSYPRTVKASGTLSDAEAWHTVEVDGPVHRLSAERIEPGGRRRPYWRLRFRPLSVRERCAKIRARWDPDPVDPLQPRTIARIYKRDWIKRYGMHARGNPLEMVEAAEAGDVPGAVAAAGWTAIPGPVRTMYDAMTVDEVAEYLAARKCKDPDGRRKFYCPPNVGHQKMSDTKRCDTGGHGGQIASEWAPKRRSAALMYESTIRLLLDCRQKHGIEVSPSQRSLDGASTDNSPKAALPGGWVKPRTPTATPPPGSQPGT